MKITRPSSIENFQESLIRVREYLYHHPIWIANIIKKYCWASHGPMFEQFFATHKAEAEEEVFWFETQGIQFEPPEAHPYVIVDGQHRLAALIQKYGWGS